MKQIILSLFALLFVLCTVPKTDAATPAQQTTMTETQAVKSEATEDPIDQIDTPAQESGNVLENAEPEQSNSLDGNVKSTIDNTATFKEHPASVLDAPNQNGANLSQVTEKPVKQRKPRFLPTSKRIDREIGKLKFVYKGELMMGLTASYGTLSSDETDLMLVFDNIKADGTIATVKPFIGYFYRDNNCIGIRFGYTHMGGTLDNADFDAGENNDLSGQLPYVDLQSNEYSFGIFHRSYAGLDPKGRFGLFAEFELALATGRSNFAYDPDHNEDGAPNRTFNNKTQVKLSFNPGAAVYIFPNVCATISFGLGGIQYTNITQKNAEGKKVGSRKASNMRFRLNIAAINIGMTIHLWDKKKL